MDPKMCSTPAKGLPGTAFVINGTFLLDLALREAALRTRAGFLVSVLMAAKIVQGLADWQARDGADNPTRCSGEPPVLLRQ